VGLKRIPVPEGAEEVGPASIEPAWD